MIYFKHFKRFFCLMKAFWDVSAVWSQALNSIRHRFIYYCNHSRKNEIVPCREAESRVQKSAQRLGAFFFFFDCCRGICRENRILFALCIKMTVSFPSWRHNKLPDTDNILATPCGNRDTIPATEIFTVCFYGILSLSHLKSWRNCCVFLKMDAQE